ncbi:MAG: PP2C family protein-serine/threonine phosphatase [Jatrophihabitantaceae bacterium]
MVQVEGKASVGRTAAQAQNAVIATPAPGRRQRVGRSSLIVLLVGLIATGALSWASYAVNSRNENRLLTLKAKETGAVLQVILPSIETPLASAAEIASASAGDPASFRSYISSYAGPKGPFMSASLWRLTGANVQLLATVGSAPEIATVSGRARSFLAGAARTSSLSVIGLLDGNQPRLGYAYTSSRKSPTYAVYAESALPPDRRASIQKGSPFSDLRFALYLGRSARSAMLLETNAGRLPISGRTATVVVPFGASALTLVASPSAALGGTLSAWLWWIVAIFGCVIAIVAAIVTERLVRRRKAAERLGREVRHLLGEQRSIAESLQRALLPRAMPAITGIDIAVRYIPGGNGVEIGGDWYDVIALDANRFFFVIGDVSGRGVDAGSVMASLHFAIRGFVSEGHSAAQILDKLSRLLNLSRDKHFATVLCGVADVDRHEITIANAGHLPPLLIGSGGGQFVATHVGPPIGVAVPDGYRTVTVTVPSGGTLLAYTDGLVERRDESLDDGLERLQQSASSADASLEELLSTIVTDLAHDELDDDTAILGVRWLG